MRWLLLLAVPAAAQTPLTPEAWEALVEGRTIVWQAPDGSLYEEAHRPGRAVDIRYADGLCETGTWRPTEGGFCYDWPGGTVCGLLVEEGKDITALVEGTSLHRLIEIHDRPICGPDLIG